MTGNNQRAQSIQRVRVGLVGLAAVILLIAFASAIMRTVTREAPMTAVGAPKADVVANMVVANLSGDTADPLAELGVAPVTRKPPAAAHR